jgi:hypothetical protein
MWGWYEYVDVKHLIDAARRLGPQHLKQLLDLLAKRAKNATAFGYGAFIIDGVWIWNNGDDPGRCSFDAQGAGVFGCNGPIAPGQTKFWYVWWGSLPTGRWCRTVSIFNETVLDPDGSNNSASWCVDIYGTATFKRPKLTRLRISGRATQPSNHHAADAARGSLAAAGPPTGTASPSFGTGTQLTAGQLERVGDVNPDMARVDHVEIALLKVTPGARPAATKAKPTCDWLNGPDARFTPIAAIDGVCAQPLWLRATGTTNWSYQLNQPLPKGDYVLYVRAVDKAGAANSDFSAADHTRAIFHVG